MSFLKDQPTAAGDSEKMIHSVLERGVSDGGGSEKQGL